jgi:thiol reductant ABC exporter CydC subunit
MTREGVKRKGVKRKSGTFARLVGLAGPFRWRILLAALLGFATVGSGVGLMMTSAFIIAKAALHPSIAELQVAIVGVRFFGIARAGFRYLERYVSHDINFRLLSRIRVWFYQALEPLAPARLQQYRSGDLLARIVSDVDALENFFVRVLAPPLTALGIALLMGLLLGRYDQGVALTVLAFLLLAGVIAPLLVRQLDRKTGARLAESRGELNATLVDGVQGMADLLAYGAEDRYLGQLQARSRQTEDLNDRHAHRAALNDANTGLFTSLAVIAALALAIPKVSAGALSGVDLAVISLGVIAAFEAVAPLPLALHFMDVTLAAAGRLFALVDGEPAVVDPPDPAPRPAAPDLHVADLTFTYDAGALPALDGLSFDLPARARVAVVGPSGGGKSTLVNLLLRFWEYDGGRILLGGRDLRAYRGDDVRGLISVVAQETHLFNASIRENLRLARPDADDAALLDAIRQAELTDFVHDLPQGLDTWVGEQGLQLSGGERQRLAIARALLKDAPILILDEATANLDAVTERQIWETLHPLLAERSTLVVTHRLTGLEQMDEILVLQDGRVIERGTHDDLLTEDGFYRRMWVLQQGQSGSL